MTEYEHMPRISQFKIYRLSPSQVNVVIRGIDLVINRDEVRDLIDSLEMAFDGTGPEIVCEVVEHRL